MWLVTRSAPPRATHARQPGSSVISLARFAMATSASTHTAPFACSPPIPGLPAPISHRPARPVSLIHPHLPLPAPAAAPRMLPTALCCAALPAILILVVLVVAVPRLRPGYGHLRNKGGGDTACTQRAGSSNRLRTHASVTRCVAPPRLGSLTAQCCQTSTTRIQSVRPENEELSSVGGCEC